MRVGELPICNRSFACMLLCSSPAAAFCSVLLALLCAPLLVAQARVPTCHHLWSRVPLGPTANAPWHPCDREPQPRAHVVSSRVLACLVVACRGLLPTARGIFKSHFLWCAAPSGRSSSACQGGASAHELLPSGTALILPS